MHHVHKTSCRQPKEPAADRGTYVRERRETMFHIAVLFKYFYRNDLFYLITSLDLFGGADVFEFHCFPSARSAFP